MREEDNKSGSDLEQDLTRKLMWTTNNWTNNIHTISDDDVSYESDDLDRENDFDDENDFYDENDFLIDDENGDHDNENDF